MNWQDISTAPHGKKVIVSVPNGRNRPPITMMGRYWPRHTLEAPEGYGESDGFEAGEDGTIYVPEGWLEEIEAEEPPLHNIKPTHWMPLPPPPQDKTP